MLLLPIGMESKALKQSLLGSTLWLGQGLTPPPQTYWVVSTMVDTRTLCYCASFFPTAYVPLGPGLNQGHTHKVLFQEVALSSHHMFNPARCFCVQTYFNVAKCLKSQLYLRHWSPCGMTPRTAWVFAFLFVGKVTDSHTYLPHPSKVPHLLQSVRSRLCMTILSWPRWAFTMVFSSYSPSLTPSRGICYFFFYVHSRHSFFLGVFTLTVVSGCSSSPLNINPFESLLISALSVKTLCINYHPTRILLSWRWTYSVLPCLFVYCLL